MLDGFVLFDLVRLRMIWLGGRRREDRCRGDD